MALTINTNVASLNAQRNLTKNTLALGKTFQRLNSGQRINSAADDAAGLAISTRMTAQIKGLNQAQRNANDAISLLQVADGSMNEITSALQRMRELAVQSANDTLTGDDRAALQQEMNQLLAEIDRIVDTTEFNGMKVIGGDFQRWRWVSAPHWITDFTTENLRKFQVGANADQEIPVDISVPNTIRLLACNENPNYDPDSSVLNNRAEVYPPTLAVGLPDTEYQFLSYLTNGSPWHSSNWPPNPILDLTGETIPRNLTQPLNATTNPPISGVEASHRAIHLLDRAIGRVSNYQAQLGAMINRFEAVASNLSNVAQNLTASRSRIQDADIAAEASRLTQTSINQQAGAAILAQANQQPQLALQLLG